MIELIVNCKGKKTEVSGKINVEGRANAVNEFYEVLRTLSDCDEDVLLDALGRMVDDKLERGDDDDESES